MGLTKEIHWKSEDMNRDFSLATLNIDGIRRSRPDLCTLMHNSTYETHTQSTGIHNS